MFEHCRNVVIKVTRDCNLRCKYCYVADKDKYKGERMSFDVFKQLINRIVEDKIKNSFIGEDHRFHIVFHGGEPTLLGYDTLNLFLSYARDMFKNNGLVVDIGIQTNTTLLTDDLLRLFKEFNVNVGTSFDGLSSSNKARTSTSEKHYIDLYKKMDSMGVEYGNISVVNPVNIDHSIKNLKYFNKTQLYTKFNYAEDVFNLGGCEVSGEEFLEKVTKPFLQKYIKWAKLGCGDFLDYVTNSIVENFVRQQIVGKKSYRKAKNTKGICSVEFCGSGCYVLEVSPDGIVNACGRYSDDRDYCYLGTIWDEDFLGLQKRIKFYGLINEKNKAINDKTCDLCPASGICDFGCMAFHYEKYKKWGIRKDLVCDFYKPLFNYLCSIEPQIIRAYIMRHMKYVNDRWSFYIPSGSEITDKILQDINKYLRKCNLQKDFIAMKDEDWKSEDKKCYQIKIVQGK